MKDLIAQIDAAMGESNPRAGLHLLGAVVKELVKELTGEGTDEDPSDAQGVGETGGQGDGGNE